MISSMKQLKKALRRYAENHKERQQAPAGCTYARYQARFRPKCHGNACIDEKEAVLLSFVIKLEYSQTLND